MSPYASAARARNDGHAPAANSPQLKPSRQAPYLRAPDRLLRAYAHDPLASLLAQGATDAEALALLEAQRAYETQRDGQEVPA